MYILQLKKSSDQKIVNEMLKILISDFFSHRGTLEESAYMFQLLGLNLLSLLAQNRLAEFHTVSNEY